MVRVYSNGKITMQYLITYDSKSGKADFTPHRKRELQHVMSVCHQKFFENTDQSLSFSRCKTLFKPVTIMSIQSKICKYLHKVVILEVHHEFHCSRNSPGMSL